MERRTHRDMMRWDASAPLPCATPAEFFARYLAHGTGATCWPTSTALHALLGALRLGDGCLGDNLLGALPGRLGRRALIGRRGGRFHRSRLVGGLEALGAIPQGVDGSTVDLRVAAA